ELPEAQVGLDDVAVRQVRLAARDRSVEAGAARVVVVPDAEIEGELVEGRADAAVEIDLGRRVVREVDARAAEADIALQAAAEVVARLEVGADRRPMRRLGDAAEIVVARDPRAERHVP